MNSDLYVLDIIKYRDFRASKEGGHIEGLLNKMHKAGIEVSDKVLMPLATDVIKNARAFLDSWPLPVETEEVRLRPGGLFFENIWKPKEAVYINLVVSKFNMLRFADTSFSNPGATEPGFFAYTNYSGQGLIWYPNEVVERGPIDENQPQKAVIKEFGKHKSLIVGHTAYGLTGRQHGLAITHPRPFDYQQGPSFYLHMHRHMIRPS